MVRIMVVNDHTQNLTTYHPYVGSRSRNFLWKWNALHGGMLFLHFIINILHYRACYLVTLVQSYGIICKFEFQNTFGKLAQYYLNNCNTFLTPCKSYRLKIGKILTVKYWQKNSKNKISTRKSYFDCIIYFLFGWLRLWYRSKLFMHT